MQVGETELAACTALRLPNFDFEGAKGRLSKVSGPIGVEKVKAVYSRCSSNQHGPELSSRGPA